MKSWMRLLAAAGPLLACETPKSVAVPASSPAASSAAPQVIAASPEAGAAARPQRLRIESPFPGGVEIVNDTDAPVGILRALPIERQDGTTWAPTHNLDMKPTCDAAPLPDCVSIPAHTRHAPLPWTGWFGCTQCGTCRANAPAEIGTYRVVAVECASGVRHEGPPLAVVGEGRFAGAPHVSSPADHPDTVQIANDSEVPMSFNCHIYQSCSKIIYTGRRHRCSVSNRTHANDVIRRQLRRESNAEGKCIRHSRYVGEKAA